MTRYTLTVPLQLNDGTPTSPDFLRSREDELSYIAGGWTRHDGVGGWMSGVYPDATYYREPVAVYVIDSDEPILVYLTHLAEDIAEWLGQEAVYLTAQDIETFLVRPAAPTAVTP